MGVPSGHWRSTRDLLRPWSDSVGRRFLELNGENQKYPAEAQQSYRHAAPGVGDPGRTMSFHDGSPALSHRQEFAVVAITALLAIGITAGVTLAAWSIDHPGLAEVSAPPCPGNGTVVFNGTVYATCGATIQWPAWINPSGTTNHTLVDFHGVAFDIVGYLTTECTVVRVTGQEPGGATFSFLIYPTPVNCQFVTPTVLSADGMFGATWHGGASIDLLVRTSAA